MFVRSTRAQTAQTRSIKNTWFVWSSSWYVYQEDDSTLSEPLYSLRIRVSEPGFNWTHLSGREDVLNIRSVWYEEHVWVSSGVRRFSDSLNSNVVSSSGAAADNNQVFEGSVEGRRDRGLSVKEPDVVYLHKRFLSSYFNDAESCFPRAAAPISLPVFKDVKQRVTLELIEAFQ